ncbi:AraD1 family protein [Gallaecimonas xiamenensis]|uniref:FAH family protein n=1 Tax=Gallaecimonas xiamenensis 3-C-1 TaxID=745411 RepID=K2JPD7_9GAMM|nr:AraD1 family protein [Gallaecimonas xiamenensis]EKE72334.1 hypothetical protein B3C1_10897 [Gallaecimonas xiamenensis 3-C-1]
MRLIQFISQDQQRAVALVLSHSQVQPLKETHSVYELAKAAIASKASLADLIAQRLSEERLSYESIVAQGRLLTPFDHPDPAHLYVTGTGLTHLGSADTRAKMHAQAGNKEAALTDSMKMFKMGLEGGKPAEGQPGVQPEWFYKGDGSIVVAPGQALTSPAFALDGGEEPEIAGFYINDEQGQPWRIGFALGNEFSDHVTERQNYLYLAHSKLRPCAVGPELLVGELPRDIRGYSRILRDGAVLWEKPFLSGEDNMSHSIANLEDHHFKYPVFNRPGDAHLHFFGTATLSFGDGIETQAGDIFEIGAPDFGRALQNPLAIASGPQPRVKSL